MKKSYTTQKLLLIANLAATVLIMLLLGTSGSHASHISAGNITYQPQGGGQYLVRLTLYRDCAGVTMFPNEYVYAHSNGNCSPDVTINVNLLPNSGQQLPASACVQGGNCYEEYIYEGVTFLPACSDWELFFTTCCRNLPDNIDNINIPINDFYISTILNNSTFPNNSSPEFIYAPIGTFCVNNTFYFDMGATDPDGDQLSFSLIGAMGFDGYIKTNLFYNPPYTPGSPLPCVTPLTINSQTGLITLTPSMAGKFVIVIAVEETDAVTGAYKSTIIRDMQVSVSANCNNIIPDYAPSVLANGINAGCGDSVITIALSANIQCGTVASDGSDFHVTDNSNGNIIPVSAASGTNCVIGLSNTVTLRFAGQLGGGNYTIAVITGTDNNTLLSECGMPMPNASQAQLSVSGNFSLTLTHTDLNCTPNSTGSITATASGLAGPFLYSIDGTNYSANNVFTGLAAGTYTVYAQAGGNCIASSTVVVAVAPTVTMSITKSDISCFNLQDGSATITVNSGAAPYTTTWSTIPPQNGLTASNLSQGTYIATVTDANSCTSTTSVTIARPDSILLTTTGSDTLCVGQQATLTANATGGTGSFTYNWTPAAQGNTISVSPSQSTSYQVTATDANGCTSGQQSVAVAVRPGITVTASADTAMCEGGTATLSASATGGTGGPYQFDWNNGTSSTNSLTVTPDATTSYTLTVNDGCTTPAPGRTITVTVNPVPVPFFAADTTSDCYPLYGNFQNKTTLSSGSVSTWSWNFGDGMVSGDKNPQHTYTQPGIYSVSLHAVSDKGCDADTTLAGFITVKPAAKPVVQFSYMPAPATILEPVITFTNNTMGASSFSWNFGDGSSVSSLASPEHTYGDTGHFQVQLTATNDIGCTASQIQVIEVLPVVSFFMPNAFSPNGDGVNDFFQAKGEYIASAGILVFNRWGQKVFESDNMTKGWDGTYNSQASPEGVYTYYIKTTGSDLKKNIVEGSFLLVR